MVATNGNRPRAGLVDLFVEAGDLLDAVFVVVGLGEGNITHVSDLGSGPGVDLELTMNPAANGRDVPQRTGTEVLIALGCAVAGGMRHADQRDVLPVRRNVRAAKQRRNTPPVEVLHH